MTENQENRQRKMSDYISVGTMISFCTALGLLAGVLLGHLVYWMLGGACLGVVIGGVAEMLRHKK